MTLLSAGTHTWTDARCANGASGAARLARGTALGRYVVLEQLGRGGMGVVYLAYDPGLRREVALKLMATPGNDALLQEAQAMARLAHPHVAAVHDVGRMAGEVFIAMEYLAGGTLKAWAARERPGHKAILNVMAQAGAGLFGAHAAGLVHGDFKPSNVLLGEDGRARVTDFGVASASWLGNEEGGALRGTLAYLAPEQHDGGPATPASDQFAFCVSLYELLTGRLPFRGERPDVLAAAKRQGLSPAERAALPRWLYRVLQQGLAAEPAQRFGSMDALLAELRRAPRKQRTRRWMTGAFALLLLGGVSHQLERERRRAVCAEAADLGSVWSPGHARSLLETLQGTGNPTVQRLAARTIERLNRYAAEIRGRTEASCKAHLLEGTQSASDDALQRACLNERREVLRLYAVTFDGRVPARLAHAHTAAAVLPRIDVCTNVAALAQRPGAVDEQARLRAAALTADLLESRVLYTAGSAEDAAEKARTALAAATALGDGWRTSEARYALGSALLKMERLDEAREQLVEAAMVARALRADELELRAQSLLVFLVGYRQAQVEQGRLWARMAKATLERLRPHEEMEAQLLNDVGLLDLISGQTAEAAEHFRQALALKEKSVGPDHPTAQWPRNNLALALSYAGRKEEALRVLEEAHRISRELLGEGHLDTLRQLTNIATVAGEAGHLGRGREALSRALESGTRHLAGSDPALAWMRGVHTKLATADGRWDEAERSARRALLETRQSYGSKSVPVAERLRDLARVLSKQRRFEEALAAWTEALDILGTQVGLEAYFAAQFRLGKAETLLAAGRLSSAEREVAGLLELVGTKTMNSQTRTHLLEVHAELLLRRGRLDEARIALEEALRLRGSEDAFQHVQTRRLLARVHQAQGDFAAAEAMLLRAREVLQRVDAPPFLADVTFELAKLRCSDADALAKEASHLYLQSHAHGRAGQRELDAWRGARAPRIRPCSRG